jgi:uncharacterized protein (TIRG00374 family)
MSFWKWFIRLCVGGALVYLLLFKHELTLKEVFHDLTELPVVSLLAALILYNFGQMLSAYRWGKLSTMGGRPVKFKDVCPIYFSGMFFNICLPTSIGGDVLRVVGLSRKTGSKSAALASVFMDRNVGLGALLLVGFVSSLVVISTVEATFRGVTYIFPLWPLFLILMAGYAAMNAALFSDSFCRMVTYCIERMRLKFVSERIEKLHNSVLAFRMPLPRYIFSFLISILYQLSEIGVVLILAIGMKIPVSAFVLAALVPFQAVASLLPITASGVGVREGLFVAVLKGQLGSDFKSEALALSLAYFGVVVLSSLFGGIVYLVSGLTRPTSIETREVEEATNNVIVSNPAAVEAYANSAAGGGQ